MSEKQLHHSLISSSTHTKHVWAFSASAGKCDHKQQQYAVKADTEEKLDLNNVYTLKL